MVETLLLVLGAGISLGLGLAIFSALAKNFLYICRPNEVLIFAGRTRATESGDIGYRLLFGGRAWLIPVLERVYAMSLETIPLELSVANAYSKGGIPLNLHAIANVKISSEPQVIGNAIERFLGRDPAEIKQVAKELLEGHLRGVLAQLTPEEVNEDRLKFAQELLDEAEDDLHKLGLELDTLKVLNVYDEVNYLNSIGRERIANVLMVADIAESNAKSEAEQAAASANQSGRIALESAETAIQRKQNELRRIKADLEAQVKSEEERTLQQAAQARAEAEQALQEIRQRLEQTRLMAEVILPARAAQAAEALRAKGAAADIIEQGRAMAESMRLLSDTWQKAGDDARDIFLIQQLDELVRQVSERLSGVSVDEVNILDTGDGQALASFVAGYPAVISKVFEELQRSTGVNIARTLTPAAAPAAAAPTTPETRA